MGNVSNTGRKGSSQYQIRKRKREREREREKERERILLKKGKKN